MRLSAFKQMGVKEIDICVLPSDTSIDKLKEIVIKDNAQFGSWDFDLLANEWDDLPLTEWGVPAWDTQEDDAVSESKEVKEDEFDETTDKIEQRCSRGDIWQLGRHRLMCGDATSDTDMAELMDGVQADMWLTDPPYNVNYEGATKDKLKIQNDNMSDASFRKFLVDTYKCAFNVIKSGGAFYIWHADLEGANFRGAISDIGEKVRECLIWKKNSMELGRQDYQWKHEPCLYGWKTGASHNWYSDRKQTTILEFDGPSVNAEHPTMKPVALFAYLIQNSSKENDVILDSFGGSGTSIIASEQTNRVCYTLELDPHYCDVILARWEKMTGGKAVKL